MTLIGLAPVDRLLEDLDRVKQAIGMVGVVGLLLHETETGPFLAKFDEQSSRIIYPMVSRQELAALADPVKRQRFLRGEECMEELGIVFSFSSYGHPPNGRPTSRREPHRSNRHPRKSWKRQP